jgi:lysophospholipase L1-like esterase
VLVVQECAVYFPGPVDAYKTQYRDWIRQIKAAGIAPVIATTVPPARSQGWWEATKDFVKERILGREGQYDQIVQFNEWLRALARDEAVVLLDLEKTLRIDDRDRHMRDAYNAGDGIHLNESAYRELDRLLYETVREKLL